MSPEIKQKFDTQVRQAVSDLSGYQADKIILFGSLARGDFDEDSDIDLLIIKKNIEEKRILDRMRKASSYLRFGLPVELVVFTPEEIESRIQQNDYFLKDAMNEGKVVYEK